MHKDSFTKSFWLLCQNNNNPNQTLRIETGVSTIEVIILFVKLMDKQEMI